MAAVTTQDLLDLCSCFLNFFKKRWENNLQVGSRESFQRADKPALAKHKPG